MRYYVFLLGILLSLSALAQQKQRMSADEYIEKYKDIAISEMKRSGIPASIILAQGLLESDNGNSILTIKGNNHFGIKCHNWDGGGIYANDDRKDECFRKYRSAAASYRDHTDFLLSRQRYSFLFAYKSTDYKDWAKGLKRAGYATNPRYDKLLIKIIEDHKLNQYDHDYIISRHQRHEQSEAESGSGYGFTIRLTRPVYKRNNIEYVVVKQGDTYEKIDRELDMLTWEITRYNELTKDSVLHEGEILYLQPKRRKAERGMDYHTVQPGETVYSISQLYGVKSKFLRKWNHLSRNDVVTTGEVLNLRKRKK